MDGQQRIARVRREYNQWAANQTLEDYALRFTAKAARRWSEFRVANTAIGGISFLALEAIGGAITLTYGFTNAISAILIVGTLLFFTGLPISYYAARHGVDIDLLTRGAGFGYLGSTITSLIYACFTFIFFAIEATILAKALGMCLGVPESIGLVISSVVVIPLVTYGFTFISRFQLWTQPIWIALQVIPFVCIAFFDTGTVASWAHYTGRLGFVDNRFDLTLFGAAAGVVFSLIAQIAEQVDFLRFLPHKTKDRDVAWWLALIMTGPGWAVLGTLKLCAGSFLAYLAFKKGVPPVDVTEPTHMYQVAFSYVVGEPQFALVISAMFVVISQLKINVTNSYAGSIAWSNFFSRLTHSHPGRVIWVVFNVLIALLLMECGIYSSLEPTLGLYAHLAVAWIGTIVADLVINKSLGLSPSGIEFRRAYLYDINPVGFGSMVLSSLAGILANIGIFGNTVAALSCFISLGLPFILAPLIAKLTHSRFYLARKAQDWNAVSTIRCCICENEFEGEDMISCPVYAGPICSLCCTLDARCHDACKPRSRFPEQFSDALATVLPARAVAHVNSSLGHYFGLLLLVGGIISAVLGAVYWQTLREVGTPESLIGSALLKTFIGFVVIAGIVCWLFVLAHESRRVAQEESMRQTRLLMEEVDAHKKTDLALQSAKEVAEAASLAKSRYLAGISHEFRTPLNTILGYAQLIERNDMAPASRANAVRTILRTGEHLAGLVEGLLDIAKIEAGRLQLHQETIAFPAFFAQVIDMFRLQAQTKGIGFSVTGAERMPAFVRTDEKRFRQILINLLSNAVKFTNKGEVAVSFRYRNEVAEIGVEDTGIGIAPNDLERVFIPFERIENPAMRWVPGTGLGLAITRLMTEVMGGEIIVRSTLGVGSRFSIRVHLPTVAGQLSPEQRPQQITGYLGRRITILVVDDEVSHRELICDLLEPLGLILITACDGPECLELAASHKPDVILLDVSMPGMNGWSVARHLREEMLVCAAIILLSADAEGDRKQEHEFDYHDGYIVKPFVIDALLQMLSEKAGIVWTYAAGAPAPVAPAQQRLDPVEAVPSRADIEDLIRLARIGYLTGLQQKLAVIEKKDPLLKRFVSDVGEMVAEMEFDDLASKLEATLHDNFAAIRP